MPMGSPKEKSPESIFKSFGMLWVADVGMHRLHKIITPANR